MAFRFPGVPSKGMPRSRARTCWVGGGEVWGSRAKSSELIARATKSGALILMVREKRSTRHVQRPTRNEEFSCSLLIQKILLIPSRFSDFCFRAALKRIRFGG